MNVDFEERVNGSRGAERVGKIRGGVIPAGLSAVRGYD